MQGTTTNGKQLLPFKTGAFLAGAPVQPCMIKYTTNKVSPSWDSIDAIWHVFLMLAEPVHKVTVYLVSHPPPLQTTISSHLSTVSRESFQSVPLDMVQASGNCR